MNATPWTSFIQAPGSNGRKSTDPTWFIPVFGAGADAGTWQIARSHDNFATTFAVRCGEADAVPVPNDYDHDGFNDLASYVFRGPRAGTWTVCTSRCEFREVITFRFGGAGSIPISEALSVTLLSRYRPEIWNPAF